METSPTPTTESYWWFQGDSVVDLYAKLDAMKQSGALSQCVFKVRPTADGKCMLSVFLHPVAARAWVIADNDELNDSHRCPIDCP